MAYGLEKPPISSKPDSFVFFEWFHRVTELFKTMITVVNVTTTYTVGALISYVRADATGGAFTVTLPDTEKSIGRKILVKKIDNSVNAVTLACTGSDTIEGSATKSMSSQWDSFYVVAGAAGSWEII